MAETDVSEPQIGINALTYYLRRIISFLENDKKTLSFPRITKELQDILVRVVKEHPEVLMKDEFSSSVRVEMARLATSMKCHADTKLTYEISDGKHGSNVLTYTKTQVNTFKVPAVPAYMRPPSESLTYMSPLSDKTLSANFKLECLNTATKFVKNDAQLNMKFPEMTAEQAEFIVNMILPGKEGKSEKTEVGFGYRSMYAPLWESMRVFSLKYEYNIETEPHKNMKRVVFQKIPKNKKTQTILLNGTNTLNNGLPTNSAASNLPAKPASKNLPADSATSSLRSNTAASNLPPNLAASKIPSNSAAGSLSTNSSANSLLSNSAATSLSSKSTASSLSANSAASNLPANSGASSLLSKSAASSLPAKSAASSLPTNSAAFPTSKPSAKAEKKEKQPKKSKTEKLILKFSKRMHSGVLSKIFVHDSLQKLSDFMMDGARNMILLRDMNKKQLNFIDSVKQLSCTPAAYMIFSTECQKYLDNIKYCMNLKHVKYRTQRLNGVQDGLKSMTFEKVNKLVSLSDVEVCDSQSTGSTLSSRSNTQQWPRETSKQIHKPLFIMKQKTQAILNNITSKMENGLLSEEIIETSLQRIYDFINDDQQGSLMFNQMNRDTRYFIGRVKKLALNEATYEIFSNKSQMLLANIRNILINRNDIGLQLEKCKKGGNYKYSKIAAFPPVNNSTENNNENINLLNTPKPLMSRVCQKVDDNVARLRAIKDAVTRTSGKRVIADFLEDISNFLNISNVDRSITFDDLSENEAQFLKHVHVFSKTEETYSMFTRECHKFLKDIRFDAQNYKLKFQMVIDIEREGFRTVILEKQIREGVPQIKKNEVQHRTRSLSAGRRAGLSPVQKVAVVPRTSSTQRGNRVNEILRAALAQPVQSDKALKMMEIMGWKGGALGPRGEGIVEPIALPLDRAKRAGFGLAIKPKPKEPMKLKPANQSSRTTSSASPASQLLPQGIKPVASLPANLLPPGILPSSSQSNLSLNYKTVCLHSNYRGDILRSILEIVSTDTEGLLLRNVSDKITKKMINFVKHCVQVFNLRVRFDICLEENKKLVAKIKSIMEDCRDLFLETEVVGVREKMVVKKSAHTPVLQKNHVTTKTYNNKTEIENQNIKQDVREITEPKKTTMSSRQWYVPIMSNKKCGNTAVVTTELETKQVSKLEALALCKVIKVMNTNIVTNYQNTYDDRAIATRLTKEVLTSQIQCLEEGDEHEKEATGNIEKPVNVRTLVKNVNIPNLTRKQLAILKQNDNNTNIEEKTTYRLRVDEYKINKKKHTDVSVTKILPEPYMSEPKKKKTKSQELNSTASLELVEKTTDSSRTPGDILLKKFTLNNNNSTENKNCSMIKDIVKAPKSAIANTMQNTVTNSGDLKGITKHIVKTVSAVNNADSSAKIVETIDLTKDDMKYQYDDNTNKVSDDTKLNCQNMNTKTPEDTNTESVNKDDLRLSLSTANLEFVGKTTDSLRTPGDILLEKLTLNNDSTENKNYSMIKDIVKAPKSVMAVLQNVVTDSGDVKTKHIVNTVSAVNNAESSAKIVETIDVTKDTNYQYDDNTNEVSDNTELNCKNMNTKIPEDTNAVSVNKDDLCLTKNDAESVAATETIQNNKHSTARDKSDENVNIISNDNAFKTNNDSKDYFNEKIYNCQILDDSITRIIINTEEEALLFNSDEEIESSGKIMLDIGKHCSTPVPYVVESEVRSIDKSKCDTIDIPFDIEPFQPVFIQERKRPSVDSDLKLSSHLPKKCKLLSDFKKVYIQPKDYPQTGIDIAKAREFQSAILKSIDYAREALPLLKCQGIQNGGLVYSCQDENSLLFLEKLVKTMDTLKLIYEFDIEECSTHKMSFRIGYLDEPVSVVLNRLELYNSDLNTSKWKVIKKEHCGDFNVIYVVVDEQSFNYVCYTNFIMYAGNDCARFSIVWD